MQCVGLPASIIDVGPSVTTSSLSLLILASKTRGAVVKISKKVPDSEQQNVPCCLSAKCTCTSREKAQQERETSTVSSRKMVVVHLEQERHGLSRQFDRTRRHQEGLNDVLLENVGDQALE